MKGICVIIALFILSNGFGQGHYQFSEVDKLNQTTAPFKIILLEATWCSICKTSKQEITKSDSLWLKYKNDFAYFELDEKYAKPITWNDSVYHFVPNGLNSGHHQLIDYLVKEKTITYPTFIIIDPNHKVSFKFEGFKSESEWDLILGSILNH